VTEFLACDVFRLDDSIRIHDQPVGRRR
jgi:hypothetical protein